MRKGVAVLAALAAGASPQAVHAGPDPTATTTYRILSNPVGGDDFLFRNGIQSTAQSMSDRLFAALASVLGGTAPRLNFVSAGDPLVGTDGLASANVAAGPLQGTINVTPLEVEGFTNTNSFVHNGTTTAMPHEMMHLRQTAAVLANIAAREGGAQAFADLVTPMAAYRAGIPYKPGNYDGNYGDYVTQAQQQGKDWILGGQMGKPPVNWP